MERPLPPSEPPPGEPPRNELPAVREMDGADDGPWLDEPADLEPAWPAPREGPPAAVASPAANANHAPTVRIEPTRQTILFIGAPLLRQ